MVSARAKSKAAATARLERRVEQHTKRYRQDADEEAYQAKRSQTAAGWRRHRHVDGVLKRNAGSG